MPRSPSALLHACLLAVLLFAGVLAHAQSVRWEPATGTLSRDQVSTLALVFQDAQPETTPEPPTPDGLSFEGQPAVSRQSTFNVLGTRAVNQSTITFSYRVRPTRQSGEVRIPAFRVQTDAGPLDVPAAVFTLGTTTVGQTGQTLDQIVSARFTPPAAPIWAGEVFQLTYVLDVDRRYATNNILAAPLQWTPAGIVAEEWSKATGAETVRNGQPRILISSTTRAIAAGNGGSTQLPPGTQLVNLPTGQANHFSIFGQTLFEQFTITTQPATLQVRPLPTPAPADFEGAVGQFKLESKVVPQEAAVGEPITWTLTLSGTGNWPRIDRLPPRELSRDFRVVTPRAQKDSQNDALFDATLSEDLVLIPQKPGRTTLGPYTLSVFNPSTGRYETLRTEPVTIEISPGATPPPAPAQTHPAAGRPTKPAADSATAASAETGPASEDLPPPTPLPSDPLPAGALAQAPLSPWPQLLLRLLPVLLLPAALWLVLARRHARTHDPLRPRREAHEELNKIIARLETASEPAASELLAWQRATRTLFGLGSATPSARDLPDPIWAALWIETERALYRPDTRLAPEWFAQARSAHARATPPRPSALAALRPAHLLPRLALWAVLLPLATAHFAPRASAADANDAGDAPRAAKSAATPATPAASQPPADAAGRYAAGDFPAAARAWREALDAAPLSWPTRHNLALALAQQGRWDEAAAHAFAATLQAPRAPEPRRLLDLVLPKASFHAPVPPTPALLGGPVEWQVLAIVAGVFVLLGPVPFLLRRYGSRPGRAGVLSDLALGAWILALLTLGAAFVALRAYGAAAHPDSILVWRDSTLRAVPTEVGEQKVTSALPAGTLARVDKQFLGWRRVVLKDGTTGWVRADSLVGLWRGP